MAEAEAFKLSFAHLVNSIDASSLLPDALSRGLITDRQRTDCVNEADPYKKAEKFIGQLQREINGDSNRFHSFVQLLDSSGNEKLASCLRGWCMQYLWLYVKQFGEPRPFVV